MFLAERNTDRRGRPALTFFRRRRTRAARRWVASRGESAMALLLLAFLAANLLAGIPHALALVGLGRTDLADAGGDLADQLLVDAADQDLGLAGRGEGDALRRRDVDVVREAELHRQRPALHRRAIADPDQLQLLLVALGHALDHVGHQGARQPPHGPRPLGVVVGREAETVVALRDRDLVDHRPRELTLGAFDGDLLALQRHGDAVRDRNHLFADAR